MPVSINQTRHQGASATVNKGSTISFNRIGGNRLDQVAFDQDIGILNALFVLTVKNMNIRDQGLLRRILCESRYRVRQENSTTKSD